jgi:hypothetical protein
MKKQSIFKSQIYGTKFNFLNSRGGVILFFILVNGLFMPNLEAQSQKIKGIKFRIPDESYKIDKDKEVSCTLFPNPVFGTEINLLISGYNHLAFVPKIKIYNVAGKLMYEDNCGEENKIDIKNLAKGVYLVNIYDDKDNIIFNDKVINQ